MLNLIIVDWRKTFVSFVKNCFLLFEVFWAEVLVSDNVKKIQLLVLISDRAKKYQIVKKYLNKKRNVKQCG